MKKVPVHYRVLAFEEYYFTSYSHHTYIRLFSGA